MIGRLSRLPATKSPPGTARISVLSSRTGPSAPASSPGKSGIFPQKDQIRKTLAADTGGRKQGGHMEPRAKGHVSPYWGLAAA